MLLTLRPGESVTCSHCGCKLCKYGYTTYEKKVLDLNTGQIKHFFLQRMQCREPNCPVKTAKGHNCTHVILPSNVVPHEEIYTDTLEDIVRARQEFETGLPVSGRVTDKVIAALEKKSLTLKQLKAKYDTSYRFLINTYVLPPRIGRLCNAVLRIKAFVSISLINLKQEVSLPPKDECLYKVETSSDTGEIPLSRISEIFCSEFVRNLSTLHARSLQYSADKMFLKIENGGPP